MNKSRVLNNITMLGFLGNLLVVINFIFFLPMLDRMKTMRTKVSIEEYEKGVYIWGGYSCIMLLLFIIILICIKK